MITPDSPYYRQVRLLVRVLPHVAAEPCFALKGGTAINLFLRDLPRLSVDIDLSYLPIEDFERSQAGIDAALRRIRDRLTSGSPAHRVTEGAARGSGLIDTLGVSDGSQSIKIEVNPVLRGAVHDPAPLTLRPAAEAEFGFAQISTLAFEDIYTGKLMAALDRQHPRDLFDVMGWKPKASRTRCSEPGLPIWWGTRVPWPTRWRRTGRTSVRCSRTSSRR